MEENKEIKVRLSTVIYLLIIIIALVIVLGVTYYFGFVANKSENINTENVANLNNNEISNTDSVEKENNTEEKKVEENEEEKIINCTEEEVINLIKEENSDYVYANVPEIGDLSYMSVNDIEKNGSKYIINVSYYVPIVITQKEYNKMVKKGEILLNGEKYTYSDDNNSTIGETKYGYIKEKSTKNEFVTEYEVCKTMSGKYMFIFSVGGSTTTVCKVEKEILFEVSNTFLVKDFREDSTYKLKDYENIIKEEIESGWKIGYTKEDGLFIFMTKE